MFQIKKLILHNFGAYFGHQELAMPSEDGVTIVWGKNGYGKTTITNAFRYVLWGKLLGRKKREKSPEDFINTEVKGDVSEEMFVELIINVDGKSYTIRRGLKPKGKGYEKVFFVLLDGTLMAPDEAKEWIENLLPWNISRFYLFDGELLDEYEDLLDENDEGGIKIKESIEDILGVPVLINARNSLKTLLAIADKEVAKEAKESESTKALANDLSKAQEYLDHQLKRKKDLEDLLDKELDKEANLEELLSNNADFNTLIGEKKQLSTSIEKDEIDLKERITEIGPKMDKLWVAIMSSIAKKSIEKEKNDISGLESAKKESLHFEYVSEYLEKKLESDDCHCPICKNVLEPDIINQIISDFNSNKVSVLSASQEETLKKGKDNIAFLESLIEEDETAVLKFSLKEITDKEISLILNKQQLKEVENKISKLGGMTQEQEEDIASIPINLQKTVKKIGELKSAIQELKEVIDSTQGGINKMIETIKRANTKHSNKAIEKREFINHLYTVFESSIDNFREDLKQNVEKDATDSFVKICHQKEFTKLRINENFGLQILKRDGTVVPNRSSGYEQVVAISLISALHKNAPIGGPVFLDSTFQRVDVEHKINTLKNLTDLSKQVIILAYPREIGDEGEVRRVLGSKLIKELSITQQSSSKSRIE